MSPKLQEDCIHSAYQVIPWVWINRLGSISQKGHKISKLEKNQRKAAHFIKQDYHSKDTGSMTAMLEELGLPTLEYCRKEYRLCQLYKISNGLIPAIPKKGYLTDKRHKRKITAKSFKDFVKTNFVDGHQNQIDNCLVPTQKQKIDTHSSQRLEPTKRHFLFISRSISEELSDYIRSFD